MFMFSPYVLVKCFHIELRNAAVTASLTVFNVLLAYKRMQIDRNQYTSKCVNIGNSLSNIGLQTTVHSPYAKTDLI